MKEASWWKEAEDKAVNCLLCPRHCHIGPGRRGFCFVRLNVEGRLMADTYGHSFGFCVDPIEKKPLNHFLPGTSVLSFGTAGCNLACKFCQNWSMARSHDMDAIGEDADPQTVAVAANRLACRSVAFTYNDPVIWAEYAIDTAKACHELDVATVAVTNGYIEPDAREAFFEHMDAANVDLKAMSESFYRRLADASLQPVLDTLEYIARQTDTWLEITNLVIPRENDSPDELARLSDWIVEHLGPDVPLHFSAFHPDYKLADREPTRPETLRTAREIAQRAGLKYVFTGNVVDPSGQSSYCPECGHAVLRRDGYKITTYDILVDEDETVTAGSAPSTTASEGSGATEPSPSALRTTGPRGLARGGRCKKCRAWIAGRFESQPGTWGPRRLPVAISRFKPAEAPTPLRETEPGTCERPMRPHSAPSGTPSEKPMPHT